MKFPARLTSLASLLLLVAALAAGAVYAQLEGADRGVPPIDSATTLEVTGIDVDVVGETPEQARLEGWKQAQSKGFKALWAKTTGRPINQAPSLSDSALNNLVSGIIIENEQIGPKRYIARLGVLFDRSKAGELLGVAGLTRRSAPMLVIPVMLTGSSYQSFESRTPWQKAWARFRTGGSPVDYVRPVGNGIDPLLLNVAQTRRPGRGWWRMLLDQYGASDVLVPEVHLRRTYPGGPAMATFIARQGPDNRVLDSFTLRVGSSAGIPRMLDEGVRRLDEIYTRALAAGLLAPDPSLTIQGPDLAAELAAQIEAATSARQTDAAPPAPLQPSAPSGPVPIGPATSLSIQVETPTAASVNQAELAVSRVPGVTSALTTSIALGGTSVMRVTFAGDPAALAAALQSQGWTVLGSGTSLRIARPGAAPAAPPPPPQPQPQP